MGIAWGVDKIFTKFNIPSKFASYFKDYSFSFYGAAEGSINCGCLEFCELSVGLSLILGEGRRGRNNNHMNRLATNNGNGSFGAAIEGKGTLNICTGTLSADLTLVFSIGTKGVISIFGYNYEYDLSYDFTYTTDPIKWQSDSLKLIASR